MSIRLAAAAAAAVLSIAAAAASAQETASRGQRVYVPVYSHIWYGERTHTGQPEKLLVSTLVSIRNTDPDAGFTLTAADYYDTDGKLIRRYVDKPVTVGAMATLEYFIPQLDSAGGSGANMLITWSADKPVSPPIIESLHAYFRGTQSMAFITQGKPLPAKE